MGQVILTATDYYKYDTQALWVWYDLYGDQEKKEKLSDFAAKLIEEGKLHEKEFIEGYKAVEVKSVDGKEAFKETLALMQEGVSCIYQGWIEAEIDGVLYRGRPDLLERVQGDSHFGAWHYRPIDVKLSGSLKPKHRNQLIFYSWVLEEVQGCLPQSYGVINRDKDLIEEEFGNEKQLDKAKEITHGIIDIKGGSKPPFVINSGAKQSPWYAETLREAEEIKDISLIYNLDQRAIAQLRPLGINTVDDMAKVDIPQLPKIKWGSVEKLRRAQLQAQALIENKLIWLDEYRDEEVELKLYFDIEGDPFISIDYLFGFWVHGDKDHQFRDIGLSREGSGGSYFLYFLAEKPEEEKRAWEQLNQWTATLPEDYRVYH